MTKKSDIESGRPHKPAADIRKLQRDAQGSEKFTKEDFLEDLEKATRPATPEELSDQGS